MSSPSPGPNLTGPQAAASGILSGTGGSRRVNPGFINSLSNMLPNVNPSGTSQSCLTSRAMTSPTQQQSQNSFLASLSSRLLQSKSISGPYSGANRSGLTDIFDTAGLQVHNNLLASFRGANSVHPNFGIPTASEGGRGPPSTCLLYTSDAADE